MDQLRGGFMPGLLGNGGGAGAGGGFPAPSLDLDFTAGEGAGSQITTTRASIGYVDTVAGIWIPYAPNVPRITDKGLLVEEARTNSIRNNSMVGAVAGTPGTAPTNWAFSGTGLTNTWGTPATSNGIDYVSFRAAGTSGSTFTGGYFDTPTGIAALTGQVWTVSVFLSNLGSLAAVTSIQLGIEEETAGGVFVKNTAGSDFKASVTGSLQRFSTTITLSGGGTTGMARPFLLVAYANGAAIDFTLGIGWPQLESGAFVTSPIRTTTTAVTRAADAVTIASLAWFNQPAGTMFADGTAHSTAIGTTAAFQIDTGAATDRHLLGIDGAGDNLVGATITAGVQQSNLLTVAAANNKLAMAYAANDEAFSGNGGAVQTDAVVTLPTGLTTARLGANTSGFWCGYIRRVGYWNTRLTNAQLQSVTG